MKLAKRHSLHKFVTFNPDEEETKGEKWIKNSIVYTMDRTEE